MVTSTVTPRRDRSSIRSQNSPARQRIDAAGRLVEKDDRRLVQDRAAQREALAPAAGEIARQRVLAALQTRHVEDELPACSNRSPVRP